jgi:hypothetical protein
LNSLYGADSPYREAMMRRLSATKSAGQDRFESDAVEERFRAWYAAQMASQFGFPFLRYPEVPRPSVSREAAAAAAMSMLMDPIFYEYAMARLRTGAAQLPPGFGFSRSSGSSNSQRDHRSFMNDITGDHASSMYKQEHPDDDLIYSRYVRSRGSSGDALHHSDRSRRAPQYFPSRSSEERRDPINENPYEDDPELDDQF